MQAENETLRNLREAVRLSPDNAPLRQHLADLLLSLGHATTAETEYRAALKLAAGNIQVRISLARCLQQQGKNSEALVIVEDLMEHHDPPANAYVLHARLLLASGERERAAAQYHRAIAADAGLKDDTLAEKLGIRSMAAADGKSPPAHSKERLRVLADENDEPTDVDIERPRIKFADVGGMERLKEEIRLKIIHPLNHPEIYRAYGKSIGGGILMYGPPGCGKTYLARATAGEVKAGFIAVGLHDVLDMYFGQSEHKLHNLFQMARRNQPCVVFFDEVDALGASRSDMRQNAGRHLINQFLAELDGVDSDNEGVLFLAATNAPWHVDSAFRRPGRFDRVIFVPPPDETARAAILRILLQGKPVEDMDYDRLADEADRFSGADLKAVVDVAVENKMKTVFASGHVSPLTMQDLTKAIHHIRPSTLEWFATAQNYARYANEGGVYDDLAAYLRIK